MHSLVRVWIFGVAMPMIYVLVLPFSTSMDANPSISAYLTSPESNGGFSVVTAPFVALLWIHELRDAHTAQLLNFFATIFTLGWAGCILFTVNGLWAALHHASFASTLFGFAGYTVALRFVFRDTLVGWLLCSSVFFAYAATLASVDATSLFLTMEYVAGFISVMYVPIHITWYARDNRNATRIDGGAAESTAAGA